MSQAAEAPVVIVSNRGPLSFTDRDGELVARRGGGGLVSGLAPLVESGTASWIAAALSEPDRRAMDRQGTVRGEGLSVRLVDLDPDAQRRYYDEISNATLWFVHHGLYDRVRAPVYDSDWWKSFDAYRGVNRRFAEAVAQHSPPGATVLVQDYHLTLVARDVRERRDDLRFVHFHHTPFAGPADFEVLPPPIRSEILDGLAAHDACGFHTDRWASNYLACQAAFAHRTVGAFSSTLNSDLDDLEAVTSSPECSRAGEELDELVGGRLLVARVDRMELSKNIVRGFTAYDRLLSQRSDLRDRVIFVATCYPSRLGVEDYRRYRDEVVAAADSLNRRWATPGWKPVTLLTDDDFPRSVALLQRYDVLLVNPIRDGLNLVAKEGPAINQRHGSVVLSTEAGSYTELAAQVDAVFPFDVEATAGALEAALDRSPAQRATRARALRELATARTPADWLADQLDAV